MVLTLACEIIFIPCLVSVVFLIHILKSDQSDGSPSFAPIRGPNWNFKTSLSVGLPFDLFVIKLFQ